MNTEEFWSLCKEHDVQRPVIRAMITPEVSSSLYMFDFEHYGFEFFFQGKYLNKILEESADIIRYLAKEDREKIRGFMTLVSECSYQAELTLLWVKDSIACWDLCVRFGRWKVCEKSGATVLECCEFIENYIRAEMAEAESEKSVEDVKCLLETYKDMLC
jgi:hypothetical protein